MNSNFNQTWGQHITWLRILIIIILVIGVFFRFANIDKKLYWADESSTSLHLSGYTREEVIQQVFDGQEIGIKDLQKYRGPNPEKGLSDTIKSLAIVNSQHPPLYFVIARFWVQLFGNSVAATRSLSAVISLLAFPCIYWLCRELFDSPLIGWVAIALVAVSPFHVLYAQEARQYSLWTVTILLSSAALLRALRLRTKLSWGIYATTLALGLYTFLFAGLVAIGHGIYVWGTESLRSSKTFIAYLLASVAGILAFTPWLWLVITNLENIQRTTNWMSGRMGLLSLVKKWVGNLSRVFIDFNRFEDAKLVYLIPWLILVLMGLIIIGYSVYFLVRNSPIRIWLFIVTLICVTPVALIIPDLVIGGIRSIVYRYFIPCYLGIELAVAYLLATQITNIANSQRQKLWQVVTIALLSSRVMSCAVSSQAEFWVNKGLEDYRQAIAIINQANQPLVVSDGGLHNILAFSSRLDPKVRLQLVVKPNLSKIPDGFSDVFLYSPSPELLERLELEQKYNIERVPLHGNSQSNLWRVKK